MTDVHKCVNAVLSHTALPVVQPVQQVVQAPVVQAQPVVQAPAPQAPAPQTAGIPLGGQPAPQPALQPVSPDAIPF